MNDIRVSLTTTHNRLELCAQTVWSLFNQSLVPAKVTVWVSSEGYLADEGIKDAPAWASELNGIKDILEFRWTKNTGPYRKLLPALEEADDKQIIVYADDDVVYARNWLKLLYAKFQQHQGLKVIASRVRLARKNVLNRYTSYMIWPIVGDEREFSDDYVITGVGGAMLRRGHIDRKFIGNADYLSVCPRADDFWISEILKQSGTPVVAYPVAMDEVLLIEHGLGLIRYNGLIAKGTLGRVINKIKAVAVGYWGFSLCNNDRSYRNVRAYFKGRSGGF